MQILLINPRYSYRSMNPRLDAFLQRPDTNPAPLHSLSLITVAGLVQPEDDVAYVDENYEALGEGRDADLVGIGFMTAQAMRAYELADAFRRRGTKVVLGGVHASVLPQEAMKHADAVVVGEAEGVWPQLVRDLRRGKLRELYRAEPRPLARSPLPRYDLFAPGSFAAFPLQPIPAQFSRGCPRNCSFCNVTELYGRRVRFKSEAQIRSEVAGLQRVFPPEHTILTVVDANAFVNRAGARRMVRAIGRTGARWSVMADVSIADDREMLALLQEANCQFLNIGFESLDPLVLADVSPWKKRRLSSYAEAVKTINDHGIAVTGNFMLGLRPHTKQELRKVRDFVLDLGVLSNYFIATPYPGTRFYDEVQRDGRLRPGLDWSAFNGFNLVYDMGMPADEVAEDLCWLYEETHARERFEAIVARYAEIWKRGPVCVEAKPRRRAP